MKGENKTVLCRKIQKTHPAKKRGSFWLWRRCLAPVSFYGGVGGWPVYVKENAPVDTDGDGMPDAWEAANGLNPKSSADGVKYNLSKEYTNLEVYINSLVEKLYPAK